MDLLEKLIKTPLRENAGSLSGNRFQYQYHWALLKLLELFDERDDFVIFLEFCEDIIVIDSSDNPQFIDFYQIKTNNKNNTYYWLIKDLTNQGTTKKRKLSFMEKLIDNYTRYDENVQTIHFVSNLHFKFGEKSTTSDNSLVLNDLDDDSIDKFKKVMCTQCKNGLCKEECKKIIHFDYSSLSIDDFRDTCIGRLSRFLDTHFKNHSVHEKALYSVLLRDIERKSTQEKDITNADDLIKVKSITRHQFKEQLHDIEINSNIHNNWNTIHMDISKIYSIQKSRKIKAAFDKLIVDILNIDNTLLHNTISFVKSCLDQKMEDMDDDDNSFKVLIDELIYEIRKEKNISLLLYDDYYLTALILREFNSYE